MGDIWCVIIFFFRYSDILVEGGGIVHVQTAHLSGPLMDPSYSKLQPFFKNLPQPVFLFFHPQQSLFSFCCVGNITSQFLLKPERVFLAISMLGGRGGGAGKE